MRNLLAIAAALCMMAGFSAFAQDGAAPGQTPAGSEAPAPAKTKKASKHAKKAHKHKKQKKEETK